MTCSVDEEEVEEKQTGKKGWTDEKQVIMESWDTYARMD